MPTVARFGNVRIVLYPTDHPPPHVHALRPDGAWAPLALNCPRGPVTVMDQSGFRGSEMAELGTAVTVPICGHCDEWRRIRG